MIVAHCSDSRYLNKVITGDEFFNPGSVYIGM